MDWSHLLAGEATNEKATLSTVKTSTPKNRDPGGTAGVAARQHHALGTGPREGEGERSTRERNDGRGGPEGRASGREGRVLSTIVPSHSNPSVPMSNCNVATGG